MGKTLGHADYKAIVISGKFGGIVSEVMTHGALSFVEVWCNRLTLKRPLLYLLLRKNFKLVGEVKYLRIPLDKKKLPINLPGSETSSGPPGIFCDDEIDHYISIFYLLDQMPENVLSNQTK